MLPHSAPHQASRVQLCPWLSRPAFLGCLTYRRPMTLLNRLMGDGGQDKAISTSVFRRARPHPSLTLWMAKKSNLQRCLVPMSTMEVRRRFYSSQGHPQYFSEPHQRQWRLQMGLSIAILAFGTYYARKEYSRAWSAVIHPEVSLLAIEKAYRYLQQTERSNNLEDIEWALMLLRIFVARHVDVKFEYEANKHLSHMGIDPVAASSRRTNIYLWLRETWWRTKRAEYIGALSAALGVNDMNGILEKACTKLREKQHCPRRHYPAVDLL